jgi:hypothetical protein
LSLPAPVPGLVVRYSYLWKREHESGRDEGVKDRPCAVLLAIKDSEGEMMVTVLPITHSPPATPFEAVEIPPRTKDRIGLDAGRSWIVITAEAFWPKPALRRSVQSYCVLEDEGPLA